MDVINESTITRKSLGDVFICAHRFRLVLRRALVQ